MVQTEGTEHTQTRHEGECDVGLVCLKNAGESAIPQDKNSWLRKMHLI